MCGLEFECLKSLRVGGLRHKGLGFRALGYSKPLKVGNGVKAE